MARALRTRPSDARGLAPYSSSPMSLGRPCASGIPSRQHQADRVVGNGFIDHHPAGGVLKVDDVGGIQQARGRGWLVRHARDDGPLLGGSRVVDRDPHEEAVALRLGERVDALRLDRVLRVATTRNGSGIAKVRPPTVTWRSAIASSSADWTRAGARLISSTSTTLARIGPGSTSKASDEGRKIRVPTMSDGIRSGVN